MIGASVDATIARVRRDPQDEESWTLLADALIAKGDTRGELINVERSRAYSSTAERRNLTRARNAILAKGARAWIGEALWRVLADHGEHGDRYDDELRRLHDGEITWSRATWIPKLFAGETTVFAMQWRAGFLIEMRIDLARLRFAGRRESWASELGEPELAELATRLYDALERSPAAATLTRLHIDAPRGRGVFADALARSRLASRLTLS